MASEPKKDSASETALRAVEDALNIEFTDEDDLSAAADSDTDPDFGELEQRLAEAANDLRRQSNETPAPRRPAARARRAPPSERLTNTADLSPANDMVNVGVSDIVYSMQAKQSSRVYWVAALLTIGWLGLVGGAYLYARSNGLLDSLTGTGNVLAGPLPWLGAGLVILPLLLIWAFALMVRRAQEMRAAAQSMTEAAIRLLRPEDTATSSVASVGRAIRREVAAINEGMERAIARAGELEQFVQTEVGNLERSYADAEVRLKGLVGDLSNERKEIVGHVDLLRDSLADTHTGITTEVDQVAARVEAAVQATTSRIVDSIDTEGLAVTGKLEEVTNRLTDMLSERSTFIADSVAQRASDFDQLIQARVSDLDNTVESRLTGFGSALDTRIESLFSRLNKQQTGVEAATTRIEHIVDEQIANAGKEIGTRGMALVKAIGTQTTALDKALADRTLKIGAVIGERLSQFGQGVTEHVDKAVLRVEERGGVLDATANRIEQAIAENAQRFDETLRERALEVARSFTSGKEVITSLLDDALESVSSKTLETKLSLEGINSEMNSTLDERVNTITSRLSESHRRMTEELDKMDNRSTGLVSEIDQRTERMGELVESAGHRLSSLIDQRSEAIHASLNDGQKRLSDVLDKMDDRSGGLINEIDQRNAALLGEIDRHVDRVTSTFQQASGDISSTLESGVSLLRENIGEGQQAIFAEIENLNAGGARLVQDITDRTTLLGETLESAGKHIGKVVDDKNKSIFATLRQGRDEFVSEFDRTSSEMFGNLEKTSNELLVNLDKSSNSLMTNFETSSNSLINNLDNSSNALIANLDKSSDEMFVNLDKTSREMFINLDAKRAEIATELTEQIEMTGRQIDSKADALSKLLTERAHAINASLGSELVETQALLENKTRDFSEALAERAKELNAIIDERGTPIVENLRGNTSLLISEIERVGENLTNGFTGLFEKVTSTTTKLDSMATRAAETINKIDKNINESAENLSQSVERASLDSENSRAAAEHTANSVSETTEYLLNNLASNSLRFEKQTKELRDSASSVTEAQKQLAAVLEARQEPLERLASDISDRSSAIEASVINFSGVLSGLFQEIAEKTSSAGKHVTKEVEKSFETALERLAETVEGMRVASEEIRGELESTRTQMRRGIMEMPVEVKESTDSMRRVLVDQISALKELSEIVTKSGKAWDVTPPVTQPRLAASGGGAGMHRSIPANTGGNRPVHLEAVRETSRAPAPDMNEAPRGPREVQTNRSRPAADTGQSNDYPSGRQQPDSGRDQGRSEDVRDEAPSPQRSAIRDMLRRGGSQQEQAGGERQQRAGPSGAPRDDRQRRPQNATDSLNSLSMDIARAIDHDTAVSVWDQYQRGERKVFTRHLYTLQGQKTFDEIRAKYSREPEFRAAVDRYIGDFEKLLKDVRQNDRDNVMTQTYLTSDTGKVYTMLAHAAGRLGDG